MYIQQQYIRVLYECTLHFFSGWASNVSQLIFL